MPIPAALNQNSFDVRWYTLRRPASPDAPACWRKWLLDSGSLTQRLIQASKGDFRVEVVRQLWGRPTRSEARELGIPHRQMALIREVQLIGNGQPWVFARTIIPASTLTGKQRELNYLGSRSLGTVLFKDPTMQRGALQISKLRLLSGETVWARRSRFLLSGKPLLVAEVFLPALQKVNYLNNGITESQ
ncbi:chorismate--pyruvate lyase family protein [Amphritea balenae]|uniref:chorismate--pyruvate lyase family protein n=1 Tax=Amphritea balenae TaxID=452629 RepID=UPI0014727A20|nr:chorismate lyase [Amphritea balenae]GGK61791.1 putative chorismate pyruvate-lyase [Amphritea balenae]